MNPARPGLCLGLLLLTGCATGLSRYPQGDGSLRFPSPPDPARITWIGELRGAESIGAGRRGGLLGVLAGQSAPIRFSAPNAVAVRGERVLVSDGQLGVIHDLDLAARTCATITHAGDRLLEGPIDVTFVEGGGFAVADSRRAAVFLFDAAGRLQRELGRGVLKRPAGLAWDEAARRLLVADAGEHRLVAFGLDGRVLERFGGRGLSPESYNFPSGLGQRAPFGLAVADAMNFRVQRRRPDAAPRVFGRKGDAAGDFALPRDVAYDSAGHLYVLDSQFENVQIFDQDDRLLLAFGGEGREPGRFSLPTGITIDARDRIWVADTYNRRVQVFQYLGKEEP